MIRYSGKRQDIRGISILEMAIVVVIIGVLAGAVLAGKALIEAAALRQLATQSENFRFAAVSFREQYRYLPGDLNNATRYWGWQGMGGCANNTSAPTNATTGVCDGNANNFFDSAGGAGSPTEIFQFWRQLALAGMISGTYSGFSNTARFDTTVGSALDKALHPPPAFMAPNVPATPLTGRPRPGPPVVGSRSGWSVLTTDSYILGDSSITGANAYREPYRPYFNSHFRVGNKNGTNLYANNFLTPAEMRDIDVKIDDGKPLTGILVPRFIYGDSATAYQPACTDAPPNASGPSASPNSGNRAYNAKYNVKQNEISCAMLLEIK